MVPFAIFLTDPMVRAYAEQRHYILKLHAVLFLLLASALPFATRSFGMLGAVLVIVGINILGKIVLTRKLGRMAGLEWRDFNLLRGLVPVVGAAAIAALVTAVVQVFLPAWKHLTVLTVCGVCYTIVYLAAVWLMRIPTPDERTMLNRLLGRAGIRHWQ